jgi:hypothetical protein
VCDGPLLDTTGHHVDQRPVINICASGVACMRALFFTVVDPAVLIRT